MADETFVRAYARAAFEKAIDPWATSLRSIVIRLSKSNDMPALDDAATPFERKRDLLNALMPPNTPPEVRNFLYTLASGNHVALLPQVVASFDQLLARDIARQAATVKSAVELTAQERGQLETRLQQQYGQGLEVEYQVDPSLLGGVVVQVGDRVIDGSLAGKLNALRASLAIGH